MDIITIVAILLGSVCVGLIFYLEKVLDKNANYDLDNRRLKEDVEKLEFFISEHFLHVMNDEELGQTFLTIVGNYVQGRELPKNFLYLVCGYSRCYRLMQGTILLEIDRFVRLTQEENCSTDKRADLLTKQKRLNDLLAELEKQSENFGNRNSKLQFIDVPDILCEQTAVTSPNFDSKDIMAGHKTGERLTI